MFCSKCGKQNRDDANFCKFCGIKLLEVDNNISDIDKRGENNSFKKTIKSIDDFIKKMTKGLFYWFKKLSWKKIIILIVALLLIGGTVFAAPKAIDYINVNKVIGEVKDFHATGDYKGALLSIVSVNDKWATKSQKEKLNELKSEQEKYIKYQETIADALVKEQANDSIGARELLQSISTDFPQYNIVKDRLTEIQIKIESNLTTKAKAEEEKARKAAVARAEAERRTQEETAAKAQAQAQAQQSQAQAQAEAAARARAQAEADAATRSAQEAETRRQQEEAEKQEQIKISFCNQVISVYNSIIDGVNYYNRAMPYANAGDNMVALAIFGQAQTAFQGAYNNATNVKNNFYNTSSSWMYMITNLVASAYHYLSAANTMINDVGYGTYSGTANGYGAIGQEYIVKFKDSYNSECAR